MKNLCGASLLHVLPASRRPDSLLPLPTPDRAAGGPGEATARALARRLALVLHDLGLDAVVPAGWITVAGAAIRLGDLDVPTADHLVSHLEDFAASVASMLDDDDGTARRRAGPGQAGLFGGGAR